MKFRQILKRSLGVSFDFDGSKFVSFGELLFVEYFIHRLSRYELFNCESVKGAFFKIMVFAGKRFPFSPPLPLPDPSITFALAPILAPPKSQECLQRAEKPRKRLLRRLNGDVDAIRRRLLSVPMGG